MNRTTPMTSSCCTQGRVAQHFLGIVLGVLLLPVGLDAFCRGRFAEFYRPGTKGYYLRIFVLETIDVACLLAVLGDPASTKDSLVAPITFNAVAIVITVGWLQTAWSHARRRAEIQAAMDTAERDSSGQAHYASELEARRTEFNNDVEEHFASMKKRHVWLFATEVGDFSFVLLQYASFCDRTACSFPAQLATIVSACMLAGTVRDWHTVSQHDKTPLTIKTEGPNMPRPASTPAARYVHIGRLLYELLDEASAATHVYCNPHLGTREVNVHTIGMAASPTGDVRADVCVSAAIYAGACWASVCTEDGLSVSALHLVRAVVTDIRKHIDGAQQPGELEGCMRLLDCAKASLPTGIRLDKREGRRHRQLRHAAPGLGAIAIWCL